MLKFNHKGKVYFMDRDVYLAHKKFMDEEEKIIIDTMVREKKLFLSKEEFEKTLLNVPKPQEALLSRQEIDNLMKNNLRFDEEYRRGVHETWGGRAIIVYDILYRLINEANVKRR